MPYSTVDDIKNDITAQITTNGNGEITGADLRIILLGMCDFLDPALKAEIIAKQGSGGSVGGADNDESFPLGTRIEAVLRDILIKTIHPTYVAPTLLLNTSIAQLARESGDIISPILNIVYTQNDGGSIVTRTLKRNGSTIASTFPYTDTSVSIPDGNTDYQGIVTYGNGATKNNNLGAPDTVGKILAGSVNSQLISYLGQRKIFGGTPASTPTTSANVRALANFTLNAQLGTQLIIPVAAGASRICFAYPASLPDVSSVRYVEFGEAELKSLFTKTTFNVEGANSYTAISYKLFTYVPIEPFGADLTYKVTI
jgi:hypothetical protein